MEKNGDPFRLVYIAVSMLTLSACALGSFSQSPNRPLDGLSGLGICLGVVLFVVILNTVSFFDHGTHGSNISSNNRSPLESQTYPISVQITEVADSSVHTSNAHEENTAILMFCNVSVVDHGLDIFTRPRRSEEEEICVCPGFPFGLFRRDQSDPLIILPNYKLSCLPQYQQADIASRPSSARVAASPEMRPDSFVVDQLEILVIFQDYYFESGVRYVEHLDHPLRLRFVVVDNVGHYDTKATDELYKILYRQLHPEPANNDDDNSWMYRSRPIYW